MIGVPGRTYLMMPIDYRAVVDGSNVEIAAVAVVLNNTLVQFDVNGLGAADIEHLREHARNEMHLRHRPHLVDELRQIATGMSAQNADTAGRECPHVDHRGQGCERLAHDDDRHEYDDDETERWPTREPDPGEDPNA